MPKLLLVSDEITQREEMVRAARGAGFDAAEIVEAASEEDAYRAIDDGQFQIAVVDIMLSDELKEEGLKVIEKLHMEQPASRIIGLTNAVDDQGVRALKAGSQSFIYCKWQQINWVALLREQLKMLRALM